MAKLIGKVKVGSRSLSSIGRKLFGLFLVIYVCCLVFGVISIDEDRKNYALFWSNFLGGVGNALASPNVFIVQWWITAAILLVSGVLAISPKKAHNERAAFWGMVAIVYYILVNANPFFRPNLSYWEIL